jgi:ADP-heptose:LPS heptosyltransferase
VESVLGSLPREGRVGIIRLRSLGDCVLTTPALDILKRARPDLRLAVMVEDRFRDIFEGNPDVEELLPPRLGALRRWRPALCLNFHGGPRSAWMTALSGARHRAGFGHFRYPVAYNVRIPRAQEILGVERTVHTAEHLASAMFYLGAPMGEIPGAKLVATEGRPGGPPHCVIHAVAATPQKTWRADGFLAVAERLKRGGLEPVFIGAAGDRLAPFRAFRTVAGAPLSEIKALLAGAALFVGNDSGPAHMAAAFGVPSVTIFGPSDPAIWGPWRTASEVVRAPGGIGRVEIAQVLDAIARLKVAA